MPLKNPIESLSFWKERIQRAKREHIHFSVYLSRPEQWRNIERKHAEILKKTVSGKVLDAGCGYGRFAPLIEDYTGVDFSPDFIELAKERNPGKTFIQADLKQLPFKDKEFDWAVASSIKEMVIGNSGGDAWEQMEKELRRVAKQVLIMKYVDPHEYEIL